MSQAPTGRDSFSPVSVNRAPSVQLSQHDAQMIQQQMFQQQQQQAQMQQQAMQRAALEQQMMEQQMMQECVFTLSSDFRWINFCKHQKATTYDATAANGTYI